MRSILAVIAVSLLAACSVHKGLPVDETNLRTLNQIAGAYPNEIGACLAPDSIEIPYMRVAGTHGHHSSWCKDGTRVFWHAHPEEILYNIPRDSLFVEYVQEYVPEDHPINTPEGMCYLSGEDVAFGIEQSYIVSSLEYLMVGVKPGVYCWWSVDQLRDAGKGTQFLPPPPGQVSWEDTHGRD